MVKVNMRTFKRKGLFTILTFLFATPKYIFYLLLFISLMVINYFYFTLVPDISTQLNTLVNFVNGHGITTATLDANNVLQYVQCSKWPAGFVLFMAPLYLVTQSAIGSVLILNACCYIFYIFFLDKYLKYLRINSLKQKFIIFFLTISVAPFIYFHTPDMLATVIALWAFYFNCKYLDQGDKQNLVLSILLLGFCYFIKYSFLPFVFSPLISFILKEKIRFFKRIKEFFLIFLLSLTTVTFFYFLNKGLVGQNDVGFATTFDLLSRKAHWNQLSHFNGFLFTFGIYEWVVENLFRDHFNLNIQFNWISIVVTTYFYFLFLKAYLKKVWVYNRPFYNSINISLSAGGLIIAFLTFLTLNNPGQTWTTPYWTFVEETRYYGPVIIIGLINILIIFLNEKKGIIIHILVPLMIVFNLFAYRSAIQLGFWGNNFSSYKRSKEEVYSEVRKSSKPLVFYFETEMYNTTPFLILQSEGETLVKNDTLFDTKENQNKYNLFLLKKDTINSFNIINVNKK